MASDRPARGLAVLALLAAVGVIGCGTATPISSAQLRDRAGAICSTASAAANAIPGPSITGMPAFLDRGVAVLSPELTALRTLHPMGVSGVTYRQALASFDAELLALGRARARLRAGGDPIVTTRRLQHELAGPEASARRAWQALGIPACLA